MARIFITGSADGLGQLAAKALIAWGHRVVLHARNERRGREALDKVPGAESVVTADLGSIDETKQLASKVNALGEFDAVIHNAGVYHAGRGAPDDLQKGYETQVWLAVSDERGAKISGRYFHHRKESRHNPEADDALLQERFLSLCEEITGASFP